LANTTLNAYCIPLGSALAGSSGFVLTNAIVDSTLYSTIFVFENEKFKYIKIEATVSSERESLWWLNEPKSIKSKFTINVLSKDGLQCFSSREYICHPISEILNNRAFLCNLAIYNDTIIKETMDYVDESSKFDRLAKAWKLLEKDLDGLELEWLTNCTARVSNEAFQKKFNRPVEEFGQRYIDNVGMFAKPQNRKYAILYFSKPVHLTRFKDYNTLINHSKKEVMENL
jgi:hypothetical protein